MQEPCIFYLASGDIAKYNITLPNGKCVSLIRNGKYQTCDPDEIDFLTRQKGLGCKKLDDAEFRVWVTKHYNSLPVVENKDIKTLEDVEEFITRVGMEPLIVQALKLRGYNVFLRKQKSAE